MISFSSLIKLAKLSMSVYQGISPSLLATISLGQGIRGRSHVQLIDSLHKSNVIQSEIVLRSLRSIDRQLFTQEKQPYENKPYKISNGQKMTDIFTHALILQHIQSYLHIQKGRVLDIGCGHGYLTYAVAKMIENIGFRNQLIIGMDINENAIRYSQNLKQKIDIRSNILQQVQFQQKDFDNFLEQQQQFDVILGGFFITQSTSTTIQSKLTQRGVGLWPIITQKGQILYKFTKYQKQPIINTLFTQRKIHTSVNKYFLEQGESAEENTTQIKLSNDDKLKRKLAEKENLKQKLKTLILEFKEKNGRVPSLSQMKQKQQFSKILDLLRQK